MLKRKRTLKTELRDLRPQNYVMIVKVKDTNLIKRRQNSGAKPRDLNQLGVGG